MRLIRIARDYVLAREEHTGAARSAITRAVDEQYAARFAADDDDQWVAEEVTSADGIELTVRCDMPDGTVRHRLRMVTSVAMERAERRLKAALEAVGSPDRGILPRAVAELLDDDSEVVAAARALFADKKEPFYSYRLDERGEPADPAEKARVDERVKRYADVFARLKGLVVR